AEASPTRHWWPSHRVARATLADVQPARARVPDRSAAHSPATLLQVENDLLQRQPVPVSRSLSDNDKPTPESHAARIPFQSHATSRPSSRSFSNTRVPALPLRWSSAQSRKNPPADPLFPRLPIHTQSPAEFATLLALQLRSATRALRPSNSCAA